MTHAALQDLLRQAVARGWCHPNTSNREMDVTLAEAIVSEVSAALSAMEGEAVGWQVRYRIVPGGWGQWHEWSLPDRPETINGWDAEYRALYTAPPPQQAGQDFADAILVAFLGRQPDADDTRWVQMRRAVAEVARNGMVRRVLEANPEIDDSVSAGSDINPAPSPGPQGGGETYYTDIANRAQAITGRSIWPSTVKAILDIATPPQPEAQVSDAISGELVEMGDDEEGCPRLVISTTREEIRAHGKNMLFRPVTVALTTSGRDGDG